MHWWGEKGWGTVARKTMAPGHGGREAGGSKGCEGWPGKWPGKPGEGGGAVALGVPLV